MKTFITDVKDMDFADINISATGLTYISVRLLLHLVYHNTQVPASKERTVKMLLFHWRVSNSAL